MRFILILSALIGLCGGAAGAETLPVGGQRELFVDHYLIDSMTGAELRLATPRDAGPVLRFDAPWELNFCGYVTVFRDGEVYRMYYRGLPSDGKDGSTAETTCYAESKDGIAWTKPNLGLFEVMGTRENNVVLANLAPFSHNFAPMLDTRAGVSADEKYKALAGTSETGLFVFVSSDGIHWRKRDEKPVITKGAFDSQNVAFWSETEQLYLCYMRTWSEGSFGGFRSVSRCTSPDFVTWSEPVEMDFGGTPREHLYTNQTSPYFRAPQIYVGTAARFMPGRRVISESEAEQIGVVKSYAGDCSDGVLLTSRGGTRYDRTFMEGFVRPGIGAENWTSRTNYPARGVIQTGANEMSLFVQHNYGQPTHRINRYTLRLDGFASLHAGYAGGEMRSKPITFSGEALYLNASTSAAGGVQVELQDAAGKPIEGFALADCNEVIGDDIEKRVTWKGGSLAPLAGKEVRLRIVLKDADVYALQFR